MAYKLTIPFDQIMPETAAFYRVHLGHNENAVTLAVGLIRKAAALGKKECGEDPLMNEFGGIAENWAVYTLLQGCYVREYHQWERAVKNYFSSQRKWNGISTDFDPTSAPLRLRWHEACGKPRVY